MSLSDYADWWDKQKAESEKILGDWVQDNPQWWTIAVATAVSTAMEVGAGTVDALRLGQGVAEGGVKGYGKDALRLLTLLGPLGKAGGAANRVLTPLLRSGNLKLAVQVVGVDGPCTFQAVNNAVALTKGRSLFLTVSDMAEAMGKKMAQLTKLKDGSYELGAWIDELVPFLKNAGMRVREVKGLSQISEVSQLAQKETGPVVFAIKATVRNATGATEELLHTVIASRSPSGAVRYADYCGKFVGTLEKLVENLNYGKPISIGLYQSTSSATIINGIQLSGDYLAKIAKGTFLVMEGLAAIETPKNGVEFAVPTSVVALSPAKDNIEVHPEIVKGSLDAYKSRLRGKPVLRMPEITISAGRKCAPRSDWLTGVQFRLNALGFGSGPVDGIMGPITRKAIITFQKTYPPLMVDGVPGPRTQSKLVQLCGY